MIESGDLDETKPNLKYCKLELNGKWHIFVLKRGVTDNDWFRLPSRVEREYIIGRTLNNLADKIPYFVSTYSAFVDDQNIYCIIENITGQTIHKSLEVLNFEEWLVIFFQLVVALETAQREYAFTHYDLHTSNVILRCSRKPLALQVTLSDLLIKINSDKYPVIIDFGLSYIEIDDKIVADSNNAEVGVYDYMCPAMDMYLFLLSTFWGAKDFKFKQKILDIFQFFQADPYDIWNSYTTTGEIPLSLLKQAAQEHARLIPVTPGVSTLSPYKMIWWLYSRYGPLLEKEGIHLDVINEPYTHGHNSDHVEKKDYSGIKPGLALKILKTSMIEGKLEHKKNLLESHRAECELACENFYNNPYWEDNPVYWIELERWFKALKSNVYKTKINRCQHIRITKPLKMNATEKIPEKLPENLMVNSLLQTEKSKIQTTPGTPDT